VGLGIGMIATMTALILGLMTASAKSAFDAKDAAVKHLAASILELDRNLADFGPEAQPIRDFTRLLLAERIRRPGRGRLRKGERGAIATTQVEGIARQIAELSPKTPAQTWFQSQALGLIGDVLSTRWTVFANSTSSISLPFLVVVTFWLLMIFASFGLRAPSNATVIAVLLICALSVGASVFLIIEMDDPFNGLMKISSAPLRYTLEHLGK